MKHLFTLFFALLMSASAAFSQAGNALHFDGTNDMVVCGLPTVFNNIQTNDFTIEAWVRPTSGIFSRIVFAQFSTSNFAALSTGGTANIYFYVVAGGINYSISTTANLPLNQWTHVAARWTAATQSVTVFFNGVQQAGTGGGTSSTGTSGLMTIGTRPGGAQYFPGNIDEVRIWSEARSLCEIQSNMNRHFTGPETNLVSFYDFNHGVAGGNNAGVTTLTDYSGTSNNGTLTNFALTGTTSNWVASAADITSSGVALGGYTVNDTAAVCSGDSYTFPDGTTQTNITTPLTHTSSFTAVNGCDSLIISTINVNQHFSQNATATVCSGDSYTFPDGTTQTNITTQVVHTSNLLASTGCDSNIVTTLEVNPSYNQTETAFICTGADYTFPDGTTQVNITAQVIHTSNLQTVTGCDSLITTTVNPTPIYALQDSGSVCSGGSYTFHDGTTQSNITTQAMHTSNLTSTYGCDSIITTIVSVTPVDTAVGLTGIVLTANAIGATFTWIDCGSGQPIPNQTGANFTPSTSGSYAVAVTQNGCTDTSNCWTVTIVGITPERGSHYSIYPNPNQGQFFFEVLTDIHTEATILNPLGQIIARIPLSGKGKHPIDLTGAPAGIYTVTLQEQDEVLSWRLVISNP